jgi:DNA-directed RNA polymerase subunit M/transcription elongation factor TFIIS
MFKPVHSFQFCPRCGYWTIPAEGMDNVCTYCKIEYGVKVEEPKTEEVVVKVEEPIEQKISEPS